MPYSILNALIIQYWIGSTQYWVVYALVGLYGIGRTRNLEAQSTPNTLLGIMGAVKDLAEAIMA